MRIALLQVPSWLPRLSLRPPGSFLDALDRAFADPPSLCCDNDALCDACRADSAPWLTGEAAVC